MDTIDHLELQRLYGGRYVALRGSEVIAAAPTYDQLVDQLEAAGARWSELTIEFVEPADAVGVY